MWRVDDDGTRRGKAKFPSEKALADDGEENKSTRMNRKVLCHCLVVAQDHDRVSFR